MSVRWRRRHATAAAHVISDFVGFIPAAIVAVFLVVLNAPTWAWVIIGLGVWMVCSRAIMREMRRDHELGRWLR